MGEQLGPDPGEMSSESEPINVKVSSGGQIYNDLGIWDQFLNGWGYISRYGWFILLGLIVLLYVWYKLRPSVQEWQRKQKERQEERNFDPVKAEKYQDAMLQARERMQRKLDEDAAVRAKKIEEREAKKRDEKIEQWETFKVVAKSKTKKKAEKSYDSNYLPLGGGGGRGGGFRPSSRRQVGGGG
ncbi:PREDICTED: selenoprotein S-like [Amphimedon queenslandica]|uniref:Selenoprotein S n=2 Tax=Amphimedon queenslandica TaxID=400682 RepID=A0AAN0IFE5_AMPQE|nr:PREDICTED: selenoprotein S-like [Amphimedon queenslandica]|eukprot:XP_003387558.1 PREDICTED: selenoprotein S-like [Amphimedon queenslandica]